MMSVTCALLTIITSADTSVRLPRGMAVLISSHNANVSIRAGDDDLLTVHGAALERRGNQMRIESADDHGRSDSPYSVTVPAWATVRVTSVGGDLTVNGVVEQVRAETVNGDVHLSGTGGSIVAETIDGNVVVSNAVGSVTVGSINGSVRLRGIRARAVRATSVNGDVSFDGVLTDAGQYHVETHNGEIVLTLPGTVSAQMNVATFNGEFESQIPATRGSSPGDRRPGRMKTFSARYGAGSASFSVSAFNGSITVLPAR